MAEQYSVQAILSLVDKGFKSGIAGAQRELTNLNGSASKVMNSVGKGLAIATGVGTAALVAFGTQAISAAGDAAAMEAQFEQVFDGMGKEAEAALNSVSKEVGALPNRLKPAMNQIASFAKVAGMDTAESLSFSERALKAASDTAAYYDKSLESTTDLLQSYLKGNFQVADSLGILSTETTRNNKAMELFGAEYKKLSGLQQQEVLLAMYEEANELSGAMGQAAREADGLENVLGNFKQAGKEAAVAFGTPFLDPFVKLTQKATEAIMAFVPKIEVMMNALSKTGAGKAMIKLFDDIMKGADKLIEKINGITGDSFKGFDGMVKNIGSVVGAFGLLQQSLPVLKFMAKRSDEVDKIFRKMPDAIGKMKGAIKTDFKLIGQTFEKFTPLSKPVNKAFESIKTKGADMTKALQAQFPKTSKAFGFLGKSVSKSANVATKSLTGVSKIGTGAVGKTASAIGNLAMAGLKLVGPLAGVGLALAGAGLAMTYFGDEINAGLDTAINQGPQIITKFAQGIIAQLPSLVDTGTQMITKLGEAISVNLPVIVEQALAIITTLVQGVMDNMPQLIQTGVQIITSLASAILTAVPQLILLGMQAILSFVQGIFDNFDMITSSASQLVTQLLTAIDTYLPQIIETGVAIITTLIQGLAENLPQLLAMGTELISGLLSAIIENLPTLVAGTVEIVTAIADGIIQNIGPLLATGAELLGQVLEAIVVALPMLAGAGLEIIMAIADSVTENFPAISEAVSAGFETISQTFETVIATIRETWNGFWETLGDVVSVAWESVTGIVSKVGEAISGTWNNIQEGWTNFWNNATNGSEEAQAQTATAQENISASAEQSSTTVGEMATQVGQALDNTDQAITTFLSDIASAMLSGTTIMVNNFVAGVNRLPIIAQSITRQVTAIFNNLRQALYTSGMNAGQGFALGLESTRGSILSTAQSIANQVVSTINKALDEHSPSRVLFKSGAYATQGLELGMASRINNVIKTARDVAMAAIPKVSSVNSGIKSFVSGVSNAMSIDPTMIQNSFSRASSGLSAQVATTSNVRMETSNSGLEKKLDAVIKALKEGKVISVDGRDLARSTSQFFSQSIVEDGSLGGRWSF